MMHADQWSNHTSPIHLGSHEDGTLVILNLMLLLLERKEILQKLVIATVASDQKGYNDLLMALARMVLSYYEPIRDMVVSRLLKWGEKYFVMPHESHRYSATPCHPSSWIPYSSALPQTVKLTEHFPLRKILICTETAMSVCRKSQWSPFSFLQTQVSLLLLFVFVALLNMVALSSRYFSSILEKDRVTFYVAIALFW